jgi:serine/threonine protein kinase
MKQLGVFVYMMMHHHAKGPRTAIHISAGAQLRCPNNDGGGHQRVSQALGAFDDLGSMRDALAGEDLDDESGRERRIFDVAITAADILRDYTVVKYLGKGTYGSAFLCRDAANNNKGCVIKFPNALVRAKRGRLPLRIPDVCIRPSARGYADVVAEGQEELAGEFHNAELILDSPYIRAMRVRQYVRAAIKTNNDVTALAYIEKKIMPHPPTYDKIIQRIVGRPLEGLTPAQYYHAEAAQATLRTHPGFYHLHSLYHYEPSIPAILSHGLDGTLANLVEGTDQAARDEFTLRASTGWAPPPMWTQVAAQLACAMAYLERYTQVAHLDHKPANIFYARLAPHQIHCAIGDFGILTARDTLVPAIATLTEARSHVLMGSLWYVPSPHQAFPGWFTGSVPAQFLSEYQYLATLVDMWIFEDDDGTNDALTAYTDPETWHIGTCVRARMAEPDSCVAKVYARARSSADPFSECVVAAIDGIITGDPAITNDCYLRCIRSALLHAQPLPAVAKGCAEAHARAQQARDLESEALAKPSWRAPPPDVTADELRFASRVPFQALLLDRTPTPVVTPQQQAAPKRAKRRP